MVNYSDSGGGFWFEFFGFGRLSIGLSTTVNVICKWAINDVGWRPTEFVEGVV